MIRSLPTLLFAGLFAVAICTPAEAAKVKTLYTFSGDADGGEPTSVALHNGSVFGTAGYGGAYGKGAIFEVTPNGREKVLHSFAGGSDDGAFPNFLLSDGNGNFYGYTGGGGSSDLGTIFELSNDGSEKLLHTFSGSDGSRPTGLVRDDNGVLYGTATTGGDLNMGVVFRLTPEGQETVLHSFGGNGDGEHPGGLITDGRGNFFGTTTTGGANGLGVVFKFNRKDKETILHSFANEVDGANPYGGLTVDESGNLYGTTFEGGPANCGTLFKLTPRSKETILHAFSCGSDGSGIQDSVVLDESGNVYGATTGGGKFGNGTFFKLTPDGTFKVLYDFAAQGYPAGNIVRADDGKIFGSTLGDGATAFGTLFVVKAK